MTQHEREVMQMALEALDNLIKKTSGQSIYSFMETERRLAMAACVGLREALAEQPLEMVEQPADEPSGPLVKGWSITFGEGHAGYGVYAHMEEYPEEGAFLLLSVEQPAQQEPVAVVSGYYGGQCVILPIDPARIFNSNTALYTKDQL